MKEKCSKWANIFVWLFVSFVHMYHACTEKSGWNRKKKSDGFHVRRARDFVYQCMSLGEGRRNRRTFFRLFQGNWVMDFYAFYALTLNEHTGWESFAPAFSDINSARLHFNCQFYLSIIPHENCVYLFNLLFLLHAYTIHSTISFSRWKLCMIT